MRKVLFIIMGLAVVAVPAAAFHDGGVAHCNGCHTMHNSQDGTLVDPDSPNGNPWLL
ncbi:cytochrome C, partial [bacterium]